MADNLPQHAAQPEPETVEAELLSEGHPGPRGPRPSFGGDFPPPPAPGPRGLLDRARALAAMAAGLGGAALLLLGLLLTTTVIGAIVGVPLMLAGMALLALALRLASNSKSSLVFRKFP